MSSLQPNATEITIYSYDLIRDESGFVIKKIYLQRIIQEHVIPIKQLVTTLTPQNTDLFSRSIYFLKRTDILALPPALQTKGWTRFFEAMYFAVPAKSCPSSIDPQERESKTKDLDETIRILTELSTDPATDQQLIPIINNLLGIFYYRAIGVPKDLPKAFSYFQSAADGGLAQAHVSLGLFYGNGLVVEKNISTTIAHFKTAMSLGSVEALYQLGNLFALAKEKIENSTPYFAEAAAKKHPIALFWMGYLAVERSKLASLPKKEKLALEHKAVNYYKEAAQLDCVVAQLALGQAYTLGYLGLPKKESLARKYLISAIQSKSSEGAISLGTLYIRSPGNDSHQYEAAMTLFLKACRYNAASLEKTIVNINKLLHHLAKTASKESLALHTKLIERIMAYNEKHQLAFTQENYTLTIPPNTSNTEQLSQTADSDTIVKDNNAFIAHGQRLRYIYLETLSAEQKEVFLTEEKERPGRSKQLVEDFLPTLSHFCNLYTSYVEKHRKDGPSIDFLTFINSISAWDLEAQYYLLTRLYLLDARDIFYIHRILGNQYFFDQLISALPFHKWENKELASAAHMMFLHYYLRIFATDSSEVGKLTDDPISSLSKLVDICYWSMCHLLNLAKEELHHQSILERLMVIIMTHNMVHKNTDSHTQHLLIVSFFTQIFELPDLTEEVSREFDESLNRYKQYAPAILENFIKLGISNIKNTLPMATKALKNHTHVNNYKTKAAAVTTFFTERYAHFHADRLEAERKAKEEAQALKSKEQSEKEIALRKILKEKVIKSQEEILDKLKKNIQTKDYSLGKTLTLQKDLERLKTLHQQSIESPTYSQRLKDKFLKTHRKIQALMVSEPSATPFNAPAVTVTPEISSPNISSPSKTNLKNEVLQQLEERETLQTQKNLISTAKREERAQARAPKRSDYEESHSPTTSGPILSPVPEPSKLNTIRSFENKATENIFISQSDEYAGKAVFLLNLINSSKSISDIRSHITHGQNLEPLLGQALKVKGTKTPLQQYSLRVNDQYRITFYWDKSGKNAYHVWFGDYHA